jgi:hypothetical protein
MSELTQIIRAADDDEWTLAEGSIDERPSMVRFRPGLAQAMGLPALPKRLVVVWEYGDDGDTGMPDAEIAEDLELFENALNEALDPDRTAVLAFVFTHLGTREWHYYIADLEEVADKINEALCEQPDLPIQMRAFDDPEWTELATVLNSVLDET